MSATRSKKSFSVNDDAKEYFENLIKPLATNDSLQEILNQFNERFNQFEEEIISKFKTQISEQEERIIVLESSLALRQNTIDVLLDKIEIKCDNNEQYSRRSCLRIHGIEWKDREDDKKYRRCGVRML